jgi:BON domain
MHDEYRAAQLRRLFAEDSEVAELGIDITFRGTAVVLSGDVASRDRCLAAERLVRQELPDCELVNEIKVIAAGPAVDEEVL